MEECGSVWRRRVRADGMGSTAYMKVSVESSVRIAPKHTNDCDDTTCDQKYLIAQDSMSENVRLVRGQAPANFHTKAAAISQSSAPRATFLSRLTKKRRDTATVPSTMKMTLVAITLASLT